MDNLLALFTTENPRPDLGPDFNGPAFLIEPDKIIVIDAETIEYQGIRFRKSGTWHRALVGSNLEMTSGTRAHWRYVEVRES